MRAARAAVVPPAAQGVERRRSSGPRLARSASRWRASSVGPVVDGWRRWARLGRPGRRRGALHQGVEERRAAAVDDLAAEGALLGPRDPELALGPGHRHVEQARLLGLGGRGAGVGDGHVAVLDAGEVHGRPLEALGGVERGDVDGIAPAGMVALGLHRGGQPGAEGVGAADRVEAQVVAAHAEQGGEGGALVGLAVEDHGPRVDRRPRAGIEELVGSPIARASSWSSRSASAVPSGTVRAPEVAQGSPHVRPIEEGGAATDAVRDARAAERLGDQVGLGVGAHQHRLLRPPPARGAGESHGPGDGDGLGAVVGVAGEVGRWTRGPRGHHVAGGLARPAQHDGGAVEDLGRRAVAAVELDHLGRRPPAVDVEEEPGVGAVPAVDRLLRVADRGDVVAVAPPGLEQAELQRVHVLELVDEQVAEPPALGGRERVVVLEGAGDEREEVVEVDEAAAALAVSRRPRRPRRRSVGLSDGLRPARATAST